MSLFTQTPEVRLSDALYRLDLLEEAIEQFEDEGESTSRLMIERYMLEEKIDQLKKDC